MPAVQATCDVYNANTASTPAGADVFLTSAPFFIYEHSKTLYMQRT
jgi:hypothetical protein